MQIQSRNTLLSLALLEIYLATGFAACLIKRKPNLRRGSGVLAFTSQICARWAIGMQIQSRNTLLSLALLE